MKDALREAKLNNKGTSLVELLVVIAIMSILTGGITYGASLLFSKDASRCATNINDAIYQARIDAMSKAGKYTLTIMSEAGTGVNTAVISTDAEGVSPVTVYLDGESNASKTIISAKMIDESGSETELSLPVVVEFDKAKGCVKVGSGSVSAEGIICFDISQKRGSRTDKVQLVTSTGKHTIGDF